MAPDAGATRREAIVRAAAQLFSRYGYRKTSVELIARDAQVAKPTLYAHFTDKDAVFVAVCAHVMERILAAATAAQHEPDVVDRLVGVLAAKFTTIFELVGSSPHARELLESQASNARDVVRAADARYLALLAATLRAAARSHELVLSPNRQAELARLLMLAGHGAAYGAPNVDAHRSNLRALVTALLEPVRAER